MPIQTATGVPASRSGTWPAVLERLPGDLEEHALLGVEEDRLARRDAEEVRVEAVDGFEEPAAPREVEAVQVLLGPARVRDLADGLRAGSQEFPEGRGPVCPGEPAADADDRDRLTAARSRRRCAEPRRASMDSPARKPASASIVG